MIPAGFEPATVRLEGECSIQLSYETKHNYLILSKKLILVNFFREYRCYLYQPAIQVTI